MIFPRATNSAARPPRIARASRAGTAGRAASGRCGRRPPCRRRGRAAGSTRASRSRRSGTARPRAHARPRAPRPPRPRPRRASGCACAARRSRRGSRPPGSPRITSCPALPARIAARLSMSARSAPELPNVMWASRSRSMSSASGLLRACTARICPASRLRRHVDEQLLAEAAGAQHRLVERVDAVGGGDADDPAVRVEAVELDEQLVERLLALVVAAMLTLLRFLASASNSSKKMIAAGWRAASANSARTRAAPRPTIISTNSEPATGKNGTPACPERLRQQRLAGARRAVEDHAARQLGAEPLELLRLGEEHEQVLQRVDDLVDAGDVAEARVRDLDLGGAAALAAAAAEPVHRRPALLARHQGAKAHDHDEHQDQREHRERARARRLVDDLDARAGIREPPRELLVGDRVARGGLPAVAQRQLRDALHRIQLGGTYGALLDRVAQRGVAELDRSLGAAGAAEGAARVSSAMAAMRVSSRRVIRGVESRGLPGYRPLPARPATPTRRVCRSATARRASRPPPTRPARLCRRPG